MGMLMWLVKHSRPDIANAVREGSKVMDHTAQHHFDYLINII